MNRDLTVDVARGIGMILVVAGHTRVNGLFGGFGERWIYSFHMPLFFMLAGYCFDEAKYPDWVGYVKRKLCAIWWPFVMLSFYIAVVSLFLYWGDDPTMSFSAQCKMLLTLDTRISPFWFLPVLFAVEIAYWPLLRLPRYGRRGVLLLCFAVGGFCFNGNHKFHDVTFLVAMVWYAVGVMVVRWIRRNDLRPVWFWIAVASICFVAHGVGVWYGLGDVVSYACGKWINPRVHFPTCLLALIGVLALSKSIVRFVRLTMLLSWIGRNSMAILAVHAFPGIFSRTWVSVWGVSSAMSYVLEVVVMVVMVWLLVKPLRILVQLPAYMMSNSKRLVVTKHTKQSVG